MNSFYLVLGSEAALADRALAKIMAELKSENAEITTLFAADTIVAILLMRSLHHFSQSVVASLFATYKICLTIIKMN
jgi:hypothetical protein